MSLIPVTILTGFLGSGKTTLLKRVLTESHHQKIAVIENEFGAENIDSDILVFDSQEQIIQMSNGCICCTIREDLRATLSDLARKKRSGLIQFDRVIIETTGMADPGPVAQTFFMDDEIADTYLLDAILTLVDAKHAQDQLDQRQEVQRQVGFADQLFLSKTDLIDEPQITLLEQRLKRINPRAPIKRVHFGVIPLEMVLDLHGFNLNAKLDIDADFLKSDVHHHGHPHQDNVKSFVFKANKPFDPAKLEDFLGSIVQLYGPNMLRYKGVLNMLDVDRKVVFQGVHQMMGSDLGSAWLPGEVKQSKMVFIGIDLPEAVFSKGLEQCLVAK